MERELGAWSVSSPTVPPAAAKGGSPWVSSAGQTPWTGSPDLTGPCPPHYGDTRSELLTLTQVHQHLALTAGTPVGGGYCNIWKEQQKGSSYLLSSLSRPCNIFLSSFSRQTPGNQERNVGVKEASAPLSRSLHWVGGRPIKSDHCKNSLTALTIY